MISAYTDLTSVVVPLSKLVFSSYLSRSSVVDLPQGPGDDIPPNLAPGKYDVRVNV